ncbi:AAA15 family ATPase/GTPase [Lewinella aquimaris]|uniref:AAA15 family ATPase/GTPase n=1 Tax=Neolewinella aquimaris TaxID=1835722 RepID=A0A840DZG1_9BACT|nr:AAA15 family ATPase/GTPase [Neolewinella aquimaris]
MDIKKLKQINLIAGRNGVGKTAVLEAIFLYFKRNETATSFILNQRGHSLSNQTDLGNLIHKEDLTTKVEVVGINDWKWKLKTAPRALLIQKSDFNKTPVYYSTSTVNFQSIEDLWKQTVLTSKEEEVLDILRFSVRDDIARISAVGGNVLVKLEKNSQPVHLSALGDGVTRILYLALSLVNTKDGILLIDEIETHLHYTVIQKLWQMLFKYGKEWNIQIVATTHSDDVIRQLFYVASANSEYRDMAQFIRLQLSRQGQHEALLYPIDDLEKMLQLELEIR